MVIGRFFLWASFYYILSGNKQRTINKRSDFPVILSFRLSWDKKPSEKASKYTCVRQQEFLKKTLLLTSGPFSSVDFGKLNSC